MDCGAAPRPRYFPGRLFHGRQYRAEAVGRDGRGRAVSACLDLAPSADALHRPANRLYERRFLRRLRRKAGARAARHPALYRMPPLGEIRSIRDFDDRVTAPHMGYRDAVDYYDRASAARLLHQIRVPTLLVHAEDDPFIVVTEESRRRIAANPALTWLATRYGGHCGFLQPANGREDAYWAENRLLEFFQNKLTAMRHAETAGVGYERES